MPQTNILLDSGTNELEIVEFYMNEVPRKGGEGFERSYYGINVAKVLEILRLPELTELPEISHPAVLGAFNLRDRIIPLVDLGAWLHKNIVRSDAPKVIVTQFNRITTAFLVSGVTRIHRVSWSGVEAPNVYVSSLAANSITGVVKIEGRIIYLLDMEKIVAELSPQTAPPAPTDETLRERLRRERPRLLVVDDSTLARNLLRDLLVELGAHVTLATNGRQALELLQGWKREAVQSGRPITEYVRAVISDVEMPVMDGHSLTARIREDQILRRLPVVLCSSISSGTLRQQGEAAGADAQISKTEMQTLPEALGRLLD